uniref:Uncharacterized protein n=1 Tax=Ascaris lumbricoides TaxID=6252 RepID=A0A0M3HKX2_ASCLU
MRKDFFQRYLSPAGRIFFSQRIIVDSMFRSNNSVLPISFDLIISVTIFTYIIWSLAFFCDFARRDKYLHIIYM